PMTVDTIFDVASLTKVVATTTSIMILVEQGKLRLNDTIGKYIPEIQDEQAKRVTIQQLMTHTSGYAPDFDLREKWTGREGMLQALYKEKLRTPPGVRFVYSDINYITLAEIEQRVSGANIFDFARNWLQKLEMFDTAYLPIAPVEQSEFDAWNTGGRGLRIAPTENIRGQNSYLGSTFEGESK